MAERLEVGTIVMGCIIGLGHGTRGGTVLVGSLIGAAVGAGDDIGLGRVDGMEEGFEFGDVVAGSLLQLGDGITVRLGNKKLGSDVGRGPGIGVFFFGKYVGLGHGTSDSVVSGTGVGISIVGFGVGGGCTGGNFLGAGDGMGGDCGDGTGEF